MTIGYDLTRMKWAERLRSSRRMLSGQRIAENKRSLTSPPTWFRGQPKISPPVVDLRALNCSAEVAQHQSESA